MCGGIGFGVSLVDAYVDKIPGIFFDCPHLVLMMNMVLIRIVSVLDGQVCKSCSSLFLL